MTCPESLRVQAYFDGETDVLTAAELERHVEGCGECRGLLADLGRSRAMSRDGFSNFVTPPALRARVMRTLDRESGTVPPPARRRDDRPWTTRAFWTGACSGMVGVAAAAAVLFAVLTPMSNDALLDSLVDDHVNSLLPGHLIGVESADHHTVKPWFAGHADVSPIVEDFAANGFRLVGGRADYLASQRAAVVVYQHGLHVINVFSWTHNSRGPPRDTTRRGYRMVFWTVGDLQYCAVSDAGWAELRTLAQLLADAGNQDRAGR